MRALEQVNAEIKRLEKEIEGMHDNGLSGVLVQKYIKCGKEGCRCMQGYRHGPYPHIQYYHNGVLRTIYIRKKRGEEYEQKLNQNRKFRKTVKELIKLYQRKIQLESKQNQPR